MLVGFFGFKRRHTAAKYLYYFIWITFVLEVSVTWMSAYHLNNLFLFHIYTILEFFFVTLIYRQLLGNEWRNRIRLMWLIFASFSIFNYSFVERYYDFNSSQRFVETILLVPLFYAHFQKLIVHSKVVYLENHPYFMLTLGFMIYFTGTALQFLFSQQIIQHDAKFLWIIHSLLNIFLNGIYTFVLWKTSRVSTFL